MLIAVHLVKFLRFAKDEEKVWHQYHHLSIYIRVCMVNYIMLHIPHKTAAAKNIQ